MNIQAEFNKLESNAVSQNIYQEAKFQINNLERDKS